MKSEMITAEKWDELFKESPKYGIGNLEDFIRAVQNDALQYAVELCMSRTEAEDASVWTVSESKKCAELIESKRAAAMPNVQS